MDYKAAIIITFNELKQKVFSINKNIIKVIESISQEIEIMKKNQIKVLG